jgi:FlaA1/EpsC-like NDP-sugar epimerase
VDAEIVFTGLRPGEKLHEELIVEGEDVGGTAHPKVMKLIGSSRVPPSWSKELEELIVCAITGERRAVVQKLDTLVKGYKPMYEFHGGPEAAGDLSPHLPLSSPPSNSVH